MVALTNISANFPQGPLRVRAQDHRYRLGAECCSKSNSQANLREATYTECNRLESCSKDPIGHAGGANFYASYFVMTGIDPSGQLAGYTNCVRKRTGFKFKLFDSQQANGAGGRIASLLKPIIGVALPLSVNFSSRGYCDHKVCDETCCGEVTAPRTEEACSAAASLDLKLKLNKHPTIEVNLSGSFKFEGRLKRVTGGCAATRYGEFCMTAKGTVGIEVCGKLGSRKALSGCIQFKLDCNSSICGKFGGQSTGPSGPSTPKCKLVVDTEFCAGWWCTQYRWYNGKEVPLW
jgi:hypothetical protein